jgi:hypothetical protein
MPDRDLEPDTRSAAEPEDIYAAMSKLSNQRCDIVCRRLERDRSVDVYFTNSATFALTASPQMS